MSNVELQEELKKWFIRKTTDSAVRRVGLLPISMSTDIGTIRSENQDRVGVLRVTDSLGKEFTICILCDGMGGMTEGAECASIAISSFLTSCYTHRDLPPSDILKLSTLDANKSVYDKYLGQGGSTLSAFLIHQNGTMLGVNVGDSRIYQYEPELNLSQISIDDTLAGRLNNKDLHNGMIGLLQYIGIGPEIEPHIIEITNTTSETFIVLTSDGIHFLPHSMLEAILANASNHAIASKRLVELSKWAGGKDNSSIIILSNQVYSNEYHPKDSNVLEVWDPFGELRIILYAITTKLPSIHADTGSNHDEPKKLTNFHKKRAPNKKTRIKSKLKNIFPEDPSLEVTDKITETEELPQLKIEFNKNE